MATDHKRPFETIDNFIKSRRGTFFEAEIFDTLLHHAFVIRSPEFALADGALFATEGGQPPLGNYTERFWRLNEDIRITRGDEAHRARILVPFDVKSCVSGRAEDQTYITSTRQQSRMGFYIAICAADPGWVEVIPNRFSGSRSTTDENRKVAVNESRKCMLPPSTYGFLSPCNSSYRMPLSVLPQALKALQLCAQGKADYVNPWTGAQFPGWRPHVEQEIDCLVPMEKTQHYSSFQGVHEVWRGCQVARARDGVHINFELVNLQPRLADFKFLVPDLRRQGQRRQVFVQHKIDSLYRSSASPLKKVAIARTKQKGRLGYYFNEFERYVGFIPHCVSDTNTPSFDYLYYQFDLTDQQRRTCTKFFFLPERVIPDEFYTTLAKDGDFTLDAFKPYWITMDPRSEWVRSVYDIIQSTPEPRLPEGRPTRSLNLSYVSQLPKPPLQPSPLLHYIEVFFRKVFYALLEQCATQRSGMVVVLSSAHPMGDLAFCRYRWTSEEQEAFLFHKQIPCTISELPATTAVVPFFLYTRTREMTTRGPSLTASEFRRLNLCSQDRLLVFDVFGNDNFGMCTPLLVVPSDDVRPTANQFAVYAANNSKNKHEEFEGRVPLLAELLHTSLNPMDYAISTGGPLLFEANSTPWIELWTTFEKIAGLEDFTLPRGSTIRRQPTTYQVKLQELHQSLVDRHALVTRPIEFGNSIEGSSDESDWDAT